MNRFRTINLMMVSYFFTIMLFAGLLTSVFFLLPLFLFPPLLSPFVALLLSSMIGTSISALASERILKPLHQLIRATKTVSTGDFSIRVKEIDNDTEVADLLRNFNHMAEELGSIEFFRNDFINSFSHEFKTPIVSIRGFAKQLQNEDLPPEKRREYTDIIINESERLANMSSNILLLTKLESQQIVADRAEYELDEQIRSCVILLEKQWSRKGLGIELSLDPVKIHGNAEVLSHLWINLIDNAVKYSDDRGHVAIECRETADGILFRIADDGPGMDENTRKHAFDKFFQGDPSHATRGNGLGLSIVKRIVVLHGGRIEVESGPGRGTTFTVRLPKTRLP